MDYNDMLSAVEEFYECAGFANFYEKVLKNKSKEEVVQMFNDLYKDCPGVELER